MDVTVSAECATASATAAKTAPADYAVLAEDDVAAITFTHANAAADPTLKVGTTDAVPIAVGGEPGAEWEDGETVLFAYSGGAWNVIDYDGEAEWVDIDVFEEVPAFVDEPDAGTFLVDAEDASADEESASGDAENDGDDAVYALACATASGTAAKVAATPPDTGLELESLADGVLLEVTFENAHSGAATLNADSLGAKQVATDDGSAVAWKAGQTVRFGYSGGRWVIDTDTTGELDVE